MQFFYWLVFLMAIGIAVFAVQNSSAPPVIIKFLQPNHRLWNPTS
jgi:hypothetical protein